MRYSYILVQILLGIISTYRLYKSLFQLL